MRRTRYEVGIYSRGASFPQIANTWLPSPIWAFRNGYKYRYIEVVSQHAVGIYGQGFLVAKFLEAQFAQSHVGRNCLCVSWRGNGWRRNANFYILNYNNLFYNNIFILQSRNLATVHREQHFRVWYFYRFFCKTILGPYRAPPIKNEKKRVVAGRQLRHCAYCRHVDRRN